MIHNVLSIDNLPISLWALNGLLVFTLSVILTGILIPRILLISFRKRLFDIPDARKIHQGAVPRLGGIAFMPAMILSIALVLGFNMLNGDSAVVNSAASAIGSEAIQLCFGLCALMMVYLVGMADDLIGVKYRAKFVVQILAAVLIVSSGMRIEDLGGFMGIHELAPWLGGLLTVITIVLVVNAVNLIDGIDGLASGLSGLALGYYAYVCYNSGNYTYAMVSLAALGTLVPFFYFNVFGDAKVGRKIFMGDTGALTTGLILSFVAIKISRLEPSADADSQLPLVMAFSPLVVPCLDVVRVFVHRLSRGHSPFLPGRTHIHHKLLAMGIHQRVAMLTIVAISGGYTALNYLLSGVMGVDLILITDLGLWVVGNLLLTRSIRRRQRSMPETRELYD